MRQNGPNTDTIIIPRTTFGGLTGRSLPLLVRAMICTLCGVEFKSLKNPGLLRAGASSLPELLSACWLMDRKALSKRDSAPSS